MTNVEKAYWNGFLKAAALQGQMPQTVENPNLDLEQLQMKGQDPSLGFPAPPDPQAPFADLEMNREIGTGQGVGLPTPAASAPGLPAPQGGGMPSWALPAAGVLGAGGLAAWYLNKKKQEEAKQGQMPQPPV